jgi:hypothetical protein
MVSVGKLLLQGATGDGAVGFELDCGDYRRYVLDSLRQDDVSRAIKSDPLLLLLGKVQFCKLGSSRAGQVREKLRIICRLKLQLRKSLNQPSASIGDFVASKHFDACMSAVRNLSIVSKEQTLSGTQMLEKPALALKAGQLLKKCALLKRGQAIRMQDSKTKEDLADFLDLYQNEFKDTVSSIARQTLSERRFNYKDVLPLTQDLIKLTVSIFTYL